MTYLDVVFTGFAIGAQSKVLAMRVADCKDPSNTGWIYSLLVAVEIMFFLQTRYYMIIKYFIEQKGIQTLSIIS